MGGMDQGFGPEKGTLSSPDAVGFLAWAEKVLEESGDSDLKEECRQCFGFDENGSPSTTQCLTAGVDEADTPGFNCRKCMISFMEHDLQFYLLKKYMDERPNFGKFQGAAQLYGVWKRQTDFEKADAADIKYKPAPHQQRAVRSVYTDKTDEEKADKAKEIFSAIEAVFKLGKCTVDKKWEGPENNKGPVVKDGVSTLPCMLHPTDYASLPNAAPSKHYFDDAWQILWTTGYFRGLGINRVYMDKKNMNSVEVGLGGVLKYADPAWGMNKVLQTKANEPGKGAICVDKGDDYTKQTVYLSP